MQALNDIVFNKTSVSQIIKLGKIKIVSGKICACDPLVESHFVPFEKEVPKGEFPVELYLEEDSDLVGMAVIWFDDNKAVKEWEMAKVPGESISKEELEEGFILGFPVESGLACFMDPEAANAFLEKEDAEKENEEHEESPFLGPLLLENGGDWAMADISDKWNMAVFSSGYGEGSYACYFGYTDQGKLSALAMDLDVFFVDGL